MMSISKTSFEETIFATSNYGQDWPGPDGDRLTIALKLLQSEPASTLQIGSFVACLQYPPSTPVASIIESTTDWKVSQQGEFHLIPFQSSFVVALSRKENILSWPELSSNKSFDEEQKESIEKAGGSVAPVEAKPVKEKFVKTSTKTVKQSSANKTEEAAAE